MKHNIPSSTYAERKDVKSFLDKMQKLGEIHIIPGNHDGNIKRLIPEKTFLHPSDGMVFKNIGLLHGHRWPSEEVMNCKHIIMAHTHPTIMLTDRQGYKTYEQCWLKGVIVNDKLKKRYRQDIKRNILVIPAFNILCGGIAVNKEGVTGPLGKVIDVKNSEVFLIDGTLLGQVKDLK